MEQSQFSLTKQLKDLWRFAWVIILVAVVAGGTALLFTTTDPPAYEATTTLMVENGQQSLSALSVGSQGALEMTYQQDIGSQMEVLKSRAVLELAITQLEPEKATNPDYLQSEILKLQGAIYVQQVQNTNLVAITVVSYDPILAQKQADAVAEAYIHKSQIDTTASIESTLKDTIERLGELQKSDVNLSISPVLPRLTAQIDAALVALDTASDILQQMALREILDATGNPVTDPGTIFTMSQLRTFTQRMDAITLEANDLAALVRQLKLLSVESNFTARSNSISLIENRIMAITMSLEGLSSEVGVAQQAETDPVVQEQLRTAKEQLMVAGAAANAILEKVVALYGVQEQYMVANTAAAANPDQAAQSQAAQSKEVSKETDANLLQRIAGYSTILTTTLNTALGEVQRIQPRTATVTQWRFGVLGEKAASDAAALREILQQLQPFTPEGDVLLRRDELSAMEIQAGVIAIDVASLSMGLGNIQSDGIDLQVTVELLNVQDSMSLANSIVGGLGLEIAGLAESGSDTTSYSTLDSLRQQLQLALLSGYTGGSKVVDTAVISPGESLFTHYKNAILATIAGLILSVFFVLVLQRFDHRVRDALQVKSQVGLPLLASIARVKDGNYNTPSVLKETKPQYLESFRLLRTNLGLDSSQGQVLLVSSPEGKEGKTTVSANLARVVALQGRKVLIIDGNLRDPGIATAFGLAEGEGLSEFLTREDDGKGYITISEGIHIFPAGAASIKSAELLSSPRMKALLEKARKTYDVIIVDSVSLTGYADTRILAKEVDGVLLVLKMDASKLDLARDSRQMLETMGVRVVGIALNKVEFKERK